MSDARFCIDYGKRNAKCQMSKCKQQIEKGALRIAKVSTGTDYFFKYFLLFKIKMAQGRGLVPPHQLVLCIACSFDRQHKKWNLTFN